MAALLRRWPSVPHQLPSSTSLLWSSAASSAPLVRRFFHVLGIETSCDDSAVAVVDATTGAVVHSALASQWAEHAAFGGIVPNLAARAHETNLPLLLQDARARGLLDSVDAVAVTRGPGMVPCLWVGVSAAAKIARELRKPLVMVNHLQAHVLVARLGSQPPPPPPPTPPPLPTDLAGLRGGARTGSGDGWSGTQVVRVTGGDSSDDNDNHNSTTGNDSDDGNSNRGDEDNESVDDAPPSYPFLSLVVSGGHSALVLAEAYDSFRLLGSTLDDAAGEAFDKVARLLHLASLPEIAASSSSKHGGALVEAAAKRSTKHVSECASPVVKEGD
jgi:hypothetical protein